MDKPVLPIHDAIDQGIRIIEEERRRIARDLHDGPIQTLTTISMKLDIVEMMIDQNPNLAKEQIRQLKARISSAANEIRQLLYDLRPVAIDEVGFIDATKSLCDEFERNSRIPVRLVVPDELVSLPMPPARQVVVYRLIQEILNNIRKHARASRVEMTISVEDHHLLVEVKDDGVGFDPDHIPAGHYGLVGMKERAAYLHGVVQVESEKGKGTTFTIRVPLTMG
jgi:two-component system sensor histidine kinase DegS